MCRPARAALSLGVALFPIVALSPVAATPLSAQSTAGSPCSLDRPVWYGDTAVRSDDGARAWDTGRRDDPACEQVLAGWMRAGWASSYASSRPDGLTAPAVGATLGASGGILIRRGALEIRVMPEVAWHTNGDVDIPASSFDDDRRYGYGWGNIDLPWRFGPDAFALVGPGRSGIRLHAASVSFGVDAEPVRWGPSRRYPLLLSGQQGSLPRVGVRTERPVDLGGFGTLDFNLLYARLTPSDWFAASPVAENRLMAGLTVAWAPGFLPGLQVGVSSLHHQDLDEFEAGSAFRWLQSPAQDPDDNSVGNGMGNAWIAWSDPDVGLEVWAEWMKDDYNRSLGLFVLEPEKGSGRTLGLRQVVDAGDGTLAFHVETTSTRNSRPGTTDDDGARGIMYTHGQVQEGHTHRGQLLGAVVGPGGDGQFLEVAWADRSRTAVQIERLRFNTDAYTERLGEPLGDEGYDVEVVGRLLHERSLGSLRARGELEIGTRHNRLFLGGDDPSWDGNVRLGVMLMWSR